MKVFISWSGDLSKAVGELLNRWIPSVLQKAETWFSPDGITKGETWFTTISGQLADINFGIICLTRDNLKAPWILFEAGAISKGLAKNHVCTLLIDLAHQDVTPPLSQFNHTTPIRDEMLKLLRTINENMCEHKLPDARFEASFLRCWPEFETDFAAILENGTKREPRPKRTTEDMVSEILTTSRSIQSFLERERVERIERQMLSLLSGLPPTQHPARPLDYLSGTGGYLSMPVSGGLDLQTMPKPASPES